MNSDVRRKTLRKRLRIERKNRAECDILGLTLTSKLWLPLIGLNLFLRITDQLFRKSSSLLLDGILIKFTKKR